jgi:hypothetical protein
MVKYLQDNYFYPWVYMTKTGNAFLFWAERNWKATITENNPEGCTGCIAVRFILAGVINTLLTVGLCFLSNWVLLTYPLALTYILFEIRQAKKKAELNQ